MQTFTTIVYCFIVNNKRKMTSFAKEDSKISYMTSKCSGMFISIFFAGILSLTKTETPPDGLLTLLLTE